MTKFLDAETMYKHVKKLAMDEGPKRVNPPVRRRESTPVMWYLSRPEEARCRERGRTEAIW
eukprot:1331512-Amphidinium_carterae.1